MLGTVWARGCIRMCVAAATACCLLAIAPGCERRSYSQDTPDDVIASAVEMIKNGDTDRLGDLVYADTPEMRMFLDRLGALFGSMQGLAAACQEKFPQELAAMREEAAKRAAEGKGNGLLSALMTAGNN